MSWIAFNLIQIEGKPLKCGSGFYGNGMRTLTPA